MIENKYIILLRCKNNNSIIQSERGILPLLKYIILNDFKIMENYIENNNITKIIKK